MRAKLFGTMNWAIKCQASHFGLGLYFKSKTTTSSSDILALMGREEPLF